MTNLIRSSFQSHPFHLVSPSPWPFYTSIGLLNLTVSAGLSMHNFSNSYYIFYISLILVVLCMSFWFRDIISEATFIGDHTLAVQRGLNLGVLLFIVSEGMFFLAIFWAFFHSALTPTVELGAQWPPMGIEPVNPFELPLLNTVILLSSGATITYAHHSLISGERKGVLYGSIATVLLAIIFTIFQGIEYNVSSFTISDGIFGTSFFFSTGFHGLSVALFIYIYLFSTKESLVMDYKNNLLIDLPDSNFSLDRKFLEWFVGFSDAESNFHIRLVDLKDNYFKSVQFTFQIGLHKDDLKTLEYIKETLRCGHISISGNRVNYFVNDTISILHIILPIFKYINLNSSKYHHFVRFAQAAELMKDKKHLSAEGKLVIIQCKEEMTNMSNKWIPDSINEKIKITKYWLSGFIDGEGTFSTNKHVPRFKLENHIKELELYNKIKEFIKSGKTWYTLSRVTDGNPTVILEINKIKEIKERLLPLLYDDNDLLLKTLKSQDFLLWLNLVDIYYKGYHTTLEGKYLVNAIKLHINKYRMTTNIHLLNNKNQISILEINNLLLKLYEIESPFEVKDNLRYYRNTNKLVSESTEIIAITKNKTNVYKSIVKCAEDLNISRSKIRKCLDTGESYKEYTFLFK